MSVNALIFTEAMGALTNHSRALGAYKVAHELRRAGYSCQVVDFFTKFSEEEINEILREFVGNDTLIVGFSSTFFESIDAQKSQLYSLVRQSHYSCYPYSDEHMQGFFQKIKDINPKVKIVLGGANNISLTAPCDAFAVGYCDQAIVEYLKYIQGKNPFFRFEKLGNNQIVFNGNDYAKFDFPELTFAWHDTDYIAYGEMLPIEISRGCIFKCKFCAFPLNGKKKLDFIRSDNILRDEFLRNYYEHGTTRYIYADDTHNDSIEKLERLHKIVTSLPFEIEFGGYIRHDLVHAHKETAALLKESGLRTAVFGIESLNHESAKAIGKGLHPEKIKELLYWLKDDVWKDRVSMSSGFIIGLPHDTPETIREWSKWLLDPNCPLDSFNIEPLYITKTSGSGKLWKSEFEVNAEKFGYVLGEGQQWQNQHFTFETATALKKEILTEAYKTERMRCGSFFIIMMTNLGYSIDDMFGKKRKPFVLEMHKRKHDYINAYKERLLSSFRK